MANQNFDPNYNIQNRELRVFVSSTFKDMKEEERRYLSDTIFPAIKQLCLDRDVAFIQYDFRWGITEEQKKNGELVDVCLSAIKKCKPFFIGLLGERYGSKPNPDDLEINPGLKNKFPFLDEDIKNQLSITEIEMQYGVLREPEPMYAVFGIRSKDFHPKFRPEDSNVDNDKNQNLVTANEDSSLDDEKLKKLKDAVRRYAQQRQKQLEYDSVDEMGKIVLSFFNDVINKLYPPLYNKFERLMVQQDSFKRQKTLLYMPRKENYDSIDNFVNDSEQNDSKQILTITGEPGNGKSALVANWIETRKDDLDFVYCFVGASEKSDNPADILKLLIAQLDSRARDEFFGDDPSKLERDLKKKPQSQNERPKSEIEKLCERFQNAVIKRQKENPEKKLVLIFDGINQIPDYSNDNDKELSWIPQLPKDVKAIFTTWESDVTMKSLRERDCAVFEVAPLTLEQRKGIISGYLKERSRELLDEQLNRIAEDEESKSPVVLRTLLDELCYLGDYTKLDNQIDSYIETNGEKEFFGRVLERLEDCYDQSKVSKLLTALSAAHSGLSDEELLGVANYREGVSEPSTDANTDTEGCTLFNWLQIVFSLDSHFIIRAGKNYFSHDLIKEASETRYETEINKFRRQIVGYMINNDEIGPRRKCEEVPWQLYQLKDWEGLKKFLLDYKNFSFMCESFSFDLEKYWQDLRKNGYSLEEYIKGDSGVSNASASDQVKFYFNISVLSESFGDYEIAKAGFEKALNIHQNFKGKENQIQDEDQIQYEADLATIQNRLGNIYFKLNERQQAEEKYKGACRIFKRLNQKCSDRFEIDQAMVQSNLAYLHLEDGRHVQSDQELSESIKIFNRNNIYNEKELNPQIRYFSTLPLLNRGVLNLHKGDRVSESIDDFKEVLRILKEINKFGEYDGDIAKVQMNLGVAYRTLENFKEAMPCLDVAVEIYDRLVVEKPSFYKDEMIMAHIYLGELDEEMGLFSDAISVVIKVLDYVQDNEQKANIHVWLGNLYTQIKSFSEAEDSYTQALAISSQLAVENPDEFKPLVLDVLMHFVQCHLEQEHYSEAKKELQEALAVAQKDDDIAYLQWVLGNLNTKTNCYTDAQDNYNESLKINRQLAVDNPDEYKPAVSDVLFAMAVLHLEQKRDSEAKAELNEALNICRNLNESDDSLIYAGNFFYQLAIIHKEGFHDYSFSKQLFQESLMSFKKLNERYPGKFEDSIREVKNTLYQLDEENNCFFKLGFKLGNFFASIVSYIIRFVKNIFRGFSSHK